VIPADWAPDGKSIVALLRETASAWQGMAIVDVTSGEVRHLISCGGSSAECKNLLDIEIAGFSPEGRWIVYSRHDLFAMDVQTGKETPLLARPGVAYWQPVWAPGTNKIVFQSDASGRSGIWAVQFRAGFAVGAPALIQHDTPRYSAHGISQDGALFYATRDPDNWAELFDVEIDPKTAMPISDPKQLSSRNRVAQLNENVPQEKLGSAWSPDGEYLAYFAMDPERALVIRSVKSGDERLLYPKGIAASDETLQPTQRLQWFPDSRYLLLHYVNGELFRFDTRTGEQQRLLEDLKIAVYRNHWAVSVVLSHDGRSIYYRPAGDLKRIVRRDLSGGPEQAICQVEGTSVGGFALSPDGSRLAVISQFGEMGTGSDHRTIMIMAATGGEPKEILRPKKWTRELIWTKDGRHLICSLSVAKGEQAELISVPVEGGEAQSFGLDIGPFDFLSLSPDGRHLVFKGVDRPLEAVDRDGELWVTKIQWPGSAQPR
jgi:Tol biopolymer transport system component